MTFFVGVGPNWRVDPDGVRGTVGRVRFADETLRMGEVGGVEDDLALSQDEEAGAKQECQTLSGVLVRNSGP